jgi:hypothetical protein
MKATIVRGWGDPEGAMRTDESAFREHLADFALDQLVLLFFDTWNVVENIGAAGIGVAQDVDSDEVDAVVRRIGELGQVPLVPFAQEGRRRGSRSRPLQPGPHTTMLTCGFSPSAACGPRRARPYGAV